MSDAWDFGDDEQWRADSVECVEDIDLEMRNNEDGQVTLYDPADAGDTTTAWITFETDEYVLHLEDVQ